MATGSESIKKLHEELHDLRRLDALVICLSHSWGGLEQVAVADALDLGGLGIPTRFLCLEGTHVHEHLKGQERVRAITLPSVPRNFLDLGLKRVLDGLVADGVNLIHTHQTTLLGSIAPWLFNKRQVALVATRHIMNNHNKKDFFHRMIYSRLDALLVMSQTLKKNVIDTHPITPAHVRTVNLGLDFEKFDPERIDPMLKRKQWGAKRDSIVIGLVGRIDPAKGQETFIKAAASLMSKSATSDWARHLKFVIVGEETIGSNTHFLDELKAMVKEFHLEEQVVFAGFDEDIPAVMAAFDIFVMPSRQEAFGLVAIEAMAMECPVVISNRGSAREIVGNEEFGLTIRAEDAFDLQRQLKYLLEHPRERAQMGKRAREHVLKHYDNRFRLRKTLEIYDRALRRRSPFRRS